MFGDLDQIQQSRRQRSLAEAAQDMAASQAEADQEAMGMAQRGEAQLVRFQDGGGLSKDAVMEAIARQRAAAGGQSGGGSGAAPQTQPQPQPQQPSMMRDFLRNPGSVLRERERAAGLRFQDGGVVPGTGTGDKIPAKYEPGEFVVSNDMIDDNPGLREQLSGLRAETLAARGKTVEEADAKALNGGRRPSLRAQAGFNGSADPDFWRGNPNPLQGNQANQTLLDAARQRIDPVQTAAREAAEASARTVPPSLPPQPTPTNPGMANPQARAAYAEMARGSAPTVAAPAAPTPVANGPTTLRKVASGVGNTLMYGGAGVGGALAAKGLSDVGAPKGTAAVPGERQSGDSASSMQIPTGGNRPAPAAQPYNFWTDNEIGRNLGNAANAIAPLGGVAMAAGAPGAATKAFGLADAAVTGLAAGVRDERDLRNPYADANAAKIAASDAQSAASDAQGKAAAPDTPTSSPGLPAGVFKHGRGQYSDSASGMGMPEGFTGRPSPQNEAIWQRMADRSQAESMARVQGGLRGDGPGSGPVEPGSFTGGYSGVIGSSDTYGNMRGRSHEQRLRDAKVSAGSIMNTRKWGGPGAENNPSAVAYRNMLEQDAQIPKTAAAERIAASKNAADLESARYSSDNSLRGTVYSADSSRAGQMATARSKQQELAYNRQRDALKDSMDIEKHDQTIRHNATSNARDRLKGMAVRDDGKGGTVVDEGRLARLESTLTKMSPGWALSGEKTQAGLLRKAEASVNILEGLNNQRNNGWLQAFGIDGKSARLDNLPHKEMKGAKLSEVGFVDGVTTPGTSRKDYVIETSGGHKLYLPRSSVNQGELELLKSLGVDVTGTKK